jgi:hypothetical protein
MSQKFHKGDLVRVADDLGPMMSHFTAGIDAIVIGSYKDQYSGSGGHNEKEYTLHLKGQGECSWYWENQLTLLEKGRTDLLAQWKAEEKAELKRMRDKDWIFSQDWSAEKMPHGASIEVLAADLGCPNMWGSRGEGINWYENAWATISHAAPFLIAKDKRGWADYAAKFRSTPKTEGEAK